MVFNPFKMAVQFYFRLHQTFPNYLLIVSITGAVEILRNLESLVYRVPTSSGKHGKITPKSSMHGKIMEVEKKKRIMMEKSWNFVKYFDEITSSQKTSCQTHKTCVSDS